MDPKDQQRTLTEDQHVAIMADRVSKETADLNASLKSLAEEKAELQTQLDTKEVELASALAAKETAEKALVDYKAEVAAQAETAARVGARVEAVKETLPHLAAEFFTTERAQRWASFDEETFKDYLGELAAAHTGAVTGTQPPAETAMKGKEAAKTATTGNLSALLRRTPVKEG